mmetsp:Transcript_30216/g.46341  ORF Transcript_30216/g.46341 Transcript_30216/m.46341 type:complete len:407 (+) Transcript_30216:130-1350(+)
MTTTMTSIIRTKSPIAMPNALWQDLLVVSRPGWWLVSLWLYVAPTTRDITDQSNDFSATLSSSLDSCLFWFGLCYVCFPLNLLTYGLNDLADAEMDKHNPRKQIWIFGSQGLSKPRLYSIIQIAIFLTSAPLLALSIFQANLSSSFIESKGDGNNTLSSVGMFLLIYLIWYITGLMVNISYNFPVLGHMSKNGPFETLVVYVGYSIVTSFSYWVNTPSFRQGPNGQPLIHWVLGFEGTHPTNLMGGGSSTSFRLFGCNHLYWTHLAFLVLRTQLWMEYMDYESDSKCSRGTTLVRMAKTKQAARWIVASVLWAEVMWTFSIWLMDPDWNIAMAFSCMGAVLFEYVERHDKGLTTTPPSTKLSTSHKNKTGKSTTAFPMSLAMLVAGQNLGGLALLYDVWCKGIFVR